VASTAATALTSHSSASLDDEYRYGYQCRTRIDPRKMKDEYVIFNEGFRDSPEWGSAGIFLPWSAWQWYGDMQPLASAYRTLKAYPSTWVRRPKMASSRLTTSAVGAANGRCRMEEGALPFGPATVRSCSIKPWTAESRWPVRGIRRAGRREFCRTQKSQLSRTTLVFSREFFNSIYWFRHGTKIVCKSPSSSESPVG
jgi:hypothetical protein